MTPTLPFLEVEEHTAAAQVCVEAPTKEVLADDLMRTLDRLHSLIDMAAVAGPTQEMESDYLGIKSWLRMNRRSIRRLLAMSERHPQERLSTWNPNGRSWDQLLQVMRGSKLAAAGSDRSREMRRLADACRAQARRARSALIR